jgi:hypothetical protein
MAFLFYELLWAGNGLGVEGAKLIANVLESNHTLTSLAIGGRIQLYIGNRTKERDE